HGVQAALYLPVEHPVGALLKDERWFANNRYPIGGFTADGCNALQCQVAIFIHLEDRQVRYRAVVVDYRCKIVIRCDIGWRAIELCCHCCILNDALTIHGVTRNTLAWRVGGEQKCSIK